MQISTNGFQITPAALLFDPEFYVFDISADLTTTKFLICEENKLELAPFIDIRFEPLAQAQFTIPSKSLFELEKMHDVKRSQSAFIFHHAFVCSTLLARCLNQIDAFFSLKEPWILRRLADIKRHHSHGIPPQKWQEMLRCYLNLLAKNYHNGNKPVIKVTNVANNLIEDVLNYLPEQPVLYLYSDLESFLISNLKKPQETQIKMSSLAENFINDGDFATKYPIVCQLSKLSFLQICALVWLVSLYNFKFSVETLPIGKIKTLNMNDLLCDMPNKLASISRFFMVNPSSSEIEKMLDSSVIKTNSKHQQNSFDQNIKKQESDNVLKKYSKEIESVKSWVSPMFEELKLINFFEKLAL